MPSASAFACSRAEEDAACEEAAGDARGREDAVAVFNMPVVEVGGFGPDAAGGSFTGDPPGAADTSFATLMAGAAGATDATEAAAGAGVWPTRIGTRQVGQYSSGTSASRAMFAPHLSHE
jgi:hypothetical protein